MIGYELGLKVMLAQTGLQGPIKNVKGPSDAAMPRQNALRLAALLECCLWRKPFKYHAFLCIPFGYHPWPRHTIQKVSHYNKK